MAGTRKGLRERKQQSEVPVDGPDAPDELGENLDEMPAHTASHRPTSSSHTSQPATEQTTQPFTELTKESCEDCRWIRGRCKQCKQNSQNARRLVSAHTALYKSTNFW